MKDGFGLLYQQNVVEVFYKIIKTHKIIMKKFSSFFLLASLIVSVSCKKSTTPTAAPIPVPGPTVVTPLITLPAGWKFNSALSANFPLGSMQAYRFDTIWAGRNTKAVCLVYNSANTGIEFKPVISATAKKPTEFFAQETGVYACINGGYFGGNQSFSLVKYNNTVSSANVKVLNRTFNGNSTPYYPTRVAFGVTSGGVPSINWIYSIGAGNDNIYSYPTASPNAEGQAPQPEPTASFPAGGSAWNVASAIGGSPMLLKNNAINISDVAELISINNTTSRPRSAIGYTANGMVVILVIEGDNAAGGYVGMNLLELANMLQSLSCTNAINLDGGGSSMMVIGGQQVIRPGDAAGERPVISAVVIKQR